jgi:hypothetical protein
MTDPQTLLQLAARCRRLAGLCATVAIARKFEALALDYEEHARTLGKRDVLVIVQHGDNPAAADNLENAPPTVARATGRR